ncbi:prenylated flavin chaperone LpdD [Methanolobus halotolerans]|uniref:Prenylated flavin chaperone LpdD-like domain-containing protein n=1 Tax=Methanolobus halotolerans TaxID=2052935 RepID=A0A4E0Q8K0_9EURY|nr:hypothetical protein [Methanolobus halotolerans]TGC11116.1 hypothetical protein CUN85_02945 [Methanolobus halotolerans]
MHRVERTIGRTTLLLEWDKLGEDYLASLTGGTAHIGAVALGIFDRESGSASSSVLTVPGHREDRIVLHGARKLSKASRSSTVLVAGIHVDNIVLKEIEKIITVSEEMIDELVDILQEEQNGNSDRY